MSSNGQSGTQAKTGRRVADLARAHDIAPTTVYGWISAGRLPAFKLGGVVLVLTKDWDAFLAKNRVGVA